MVVVVIVVDVVVMVLVLVLAGVVLGGGGGGGGGNSCMGLHCIPVVGSGNSLDFLSGWWGFHCGFHWFPLVCSGSVVGNGVAYDCTRTGFPL